MAKEDCWLQITSGRGPVECCWAVAQLANKVMQEAQEHGFVAKIIMAIPGEKFRTFKSVLLSLSGENRAFVSGLAGTVLWIERSPFRPNHKRKNWYVGVEVFALPATFQWSAEDLKIETMRASGPGGQNVNKVESAVRVTHLPTGLTVSAREERSQGMNKKLAIARIYAKLKQEKEKAENCQKKDRWQGHNELERGNPIRVYKNGKLCQTLT